jgi:hypothetical protein
MKGKKREEREVCEFHSFFFIEEEGETKKRRWN